MPMTVAKSIVFLYNLNRFLPETILETYTFRLFIHTCRMVWKHDMELTYHNYTSKILVLHKKAILAINNPAYIEHTNVYFKCDKILKLSLQ